VRVDEWQVSGSVAPQDGRVTVSRFVIRAGGASISFAGSIHDAPGSPEINLAGELNELQDMGVGRFRLSPHSCDMVEVATIFRALLDRRIDARQAAARLDALKLAAPFSNGFYYGKPGHEWNRANLNS
jgi:hypothetical protein